MSFLIDNQPSYSHEAVSTAPWAHHRSSTSHGGAEFEFALQHLLDSAKNIIGLEQDIRHLFLAFLQIGCNAHDVYQACHSHNLSLSLSHALQCLGDVELRHAQRVSDPRSEMSFRVRQILACMDIKTPFLFLVANVLPHLDQQPLFLHMFEAVVWGVGEDIATNGRGPRPAMVRRVRNALVNDLDAANAIDRERFYATTTAESRAQQSFWFPGLEHMTPLVDSEDIAAAAAAATAVVDDDELAPYLEQFGYGNSHAVRIEPTGAPLDLEPHTFVAQAVEVGWRCMVCLEGCEAEQSPLLGLHVCKHVYHTECLAEWGNSRTDVVTCPMCRAQVCAPRATRAVLEDEE